MRLAIRLLLVIYTDAIAYVVSAKRYIIFEDVGPFFTMWRTLPTFFLVSISVLYPFSTVVNILRLPPFLYIRSLVCSDGHLRIL